MSLEAWPNVWFGKQDAPCSRSNRRPPVLELRGTGFDRETVLLVQ